MSKSPKSPKKPLRNPNINTTGDLESPDERELEDRVGRKEGEEPELVPPGTVTEDLDDAVTSRGERGDDDTGEGGRARVTRDRGPDHVAGREVRELDDEALVADRANARTSDRRDARDGVDGSDFLVIDPDSAGGKGPR
jgi:hypothetical protein